MAKWKKNVSLEKGQNGKMGNLSNGKMRKLPYDNMRKMENCIIGQWKICLRANEKLLELEICLMARWKIA